MKRSSLFRIILYIVCAITVLLVILVACLFSVVGHEMYAGMKIDELKPKAQSISQRVTKLYESNTDKRTLARMLHLGEFSASDATIYIIEPNGAVVTTAEQAEYDQSVETVRRCFQTVIQGEEIALPSTDIGIVVGTPVYSDSGDIIGSVILVVGSKQAESTLAKLAVELGLAMLGIALLMLIPIVIIFSKVTKPIRHVSNVALQMAGGDLTVRAKEEGSNESRHLAQSFNILAEALQNNIDSLVVERNRLRTVLDGIGEGIISVDKTGIVTHYNSASVQLLGGKENTHPAAAAGYPKIAAVAIEALDTDEVRNCDFTIGERMLRIAATPIHEENGSLFGAVVLITDVTESERLEQTRKDYVANVSHELRTPLASIRSLADALNDGMVQDEKDRKRYYGYILRESIRLSNLINDLLELSRLQSGGVAFSKGRVELYEIAYDVADRMNDAAAQRGKSVRLEAPEGEYYAYTNADRIEQVLIALVDNAIKHGTDGCTVSVNLFENAEKNRYEFVVSNPAEVDPADLEHLFERFYKADHAHTGDGTGLGLAIVSEVLNLLGEKIDIEYENGIIAFRFTAEKCSTPKKHRALQKAENKNEDGEPTA